MPSIFRRRKNQAISTELYLQQAPEIASFLKKFYSKSDALTILDIGACEALDSIKYCNMFPNAKLYAFEPVPSNIKKIEANIAKYKKSSITLIKEALSDQQGEATFFVSSGHPDKLPKSDSWDYGNKSSSLLSPQLEKNSWLKFDQEITVKTNTLKLACEKLNIDSIDLIHMDVQGAELLVLKGADDLINRISVIWLEVEKKELYKGQPLQPDVESFMDRNNFIKLKDTVGDISGDQLYISNEFLQHTQKNLSLFKKIKSCFGVY